MRGTVRILVIGSATLRREVARALPTCQTAAADTLLGGIWTAGHRDFEGVVVGLDAGQHAGRAIRSLRVVVPQARIVVTCAPSNEPQAREIVSAGADDYVIEPIARPELERALNLATVAPPPPTGNGLPSMQELVHLSDVLKNLQEGPQAILDRLAGLLRRAFGADHVTLQVDNLVSAAGQNTAPVLQESIRRQETVIGSIALGPRQRGTYTARDAARLSDYARLVEAIMTQARQQEHWQDLAWRDDLTGLRNRRYFDQTLDDLMVQAGSERLRLTVALFDIDDFKEYNDRYGHDTGDALLREVAILLTRCSREHDVVARYGGDEFAVVMWDAEKPRIPGSQHPSEAIELAERFRRVIGEHQFHCLGESAPGPVTLSGGLACFPWDGKTRADIMHAADQALLSAKRTGKNCMALAGAPAEAGGEDSASDDDGSPPRNTPTSPPHQQQPTAQHTTEPPREE